VLVSIRVPSPLLARLDALARRTGRTRSDAGLLLWDLAMVEVEKARGRRLEPLMPGQRYSRRKQPPHVRLSLVMAARMAARIVGSRSTWAARCVSSRLASPASSMSWMMASCSAS
jgi:hypothetical protein